jgi:DNA polymerase-3 subunit gamma/tau
VTVLSRCQRFDLRRIDAATLIKHLEGIAAQEDIETEAEALALLARAAEGSVRDALSLFDQAIAHAAGLVRAQDVRGMLGLADRTRVIDLFEALMKGDIARALDELRSQYDSGADPLVVLADLAEFTHFVTRVKIVPAVADDISLGEAERSRGRSFATVLSMRVLSRTWQMLLKGIAEVKEADRPIAAAEMVLVRIAYAADLPTPDEAIRNVIENGGAAQPQGNGGAASSAPRGSASVPAPVSPSAAQPRFEAPRGGPRTALAPAMQPVGNPVARAAAPQPEEPARAIGTFEEIVALAAEKRDLQMKSALERDVRLVRCDDGRLEISLEATAAKTLVNELSRKLEQWTGRRWMVSVSAEAGAATLKSQADARRTALETGVRADPLVKAVLDRWPGAEVTGVRGPKHELPEAAPGDDALPPADEDGFGDNWVRDDGVD